MPRLRRRTCSRAVLVVAAAALLAAACSPNTPPQALEPTSSLDIVGTDSLRFEPADHVIVAGDAVALTLRSEDAVEHDLVIEGAGSFGEVVELGDGHRLATAGLVPEEDVVAAYAGAGEQVTSRFVIGEAGVYTVYCSIPGHRAAGMVGQLTVLQRDR